MVEGEEREEGDVVEGEEEEEEEKDGLFVCL